jgi:cytosine/creatinine deaminase
MDLDALLTIAALPTGGSSISGSPAGVLRPSARTRRAVAVEPRADPRYRRRLVLPGLVDHMHLDETLVGLPWMPHAAGPARMNRIETDKESCHVCRSPPRNAPVI